jgi:hypothetical protein
VSASGQHSASAPEDPTIFSLTPKLPSSASAETFLGRPMALFLVPLLPEADSSLSISYAAITCQFSCRKWTYVCSLTRAIRKQRSVCIRVSFGRKDLLLPWSREQVLERGRCCQSSMLRSDPGLRSNHAVWFGASNDFVDRHSRITYLHDFATVLSIVLNLNSPFRPQPFCPFTTLGRKSSYIAKPLLPNSSSLPFHSSSAFCIALLTFP